jgi:hypothetical protein
MKMTHISVRLRRTVTEEVHVSVPVDNSLISPQPEHDGTYRLDTDKVCVRAIEMGREATGWRAEGVKIEPHPIQTPRPPEE